MRRLGREDGYAALAALLAAACFALIATQISRTSRSGVIGVNATAVHARLAAAADAGLAIALDRLLADDPGARWGIEGDAHTDSLGDIALRIAIEDERGKAPLNALNPEQARRMFQLAGASPSDAATFADSFIRWRDPPASPVATADGERAAGDLQSVDELRALPGVPASLVEAIAPYATVDTADAPFDPRFASPFARAVVGEKPPSAFEEINRAREQNGQQTAFTQAEAPPRLAGRILTVRVAASDPADGRLDTAVVIQLTGKPDHPFVVRRRLF